MERRRRPARPGHAGRIPQQWQFVTEAGAIIGGSGAKGHRTHAFVWTEAGGLVEMPSLSRLENVDAASRTGAFTGFTIDKKSLHAMLWAPSPASSKQ